MLQRLELVLAGVVQGVGFRPFVFRVASKYQLDGWVRNENGQVRIQVQGHTPTLELFKTDLLRDAPLHSRPQLLLEHLLQPVSQSGFVILSSTHQGAIDIHVPPDRHLCDDCSRELEDKNNRRYHYAFTNCTACGPRYSIITAIPYDRGNTSMADFPMCEACRREYENPIDRRYHAEPIACPSCGPQIIFESPSDSYQQDEALEACIKLLQAGEMVIVKGIGGYHICCDALNSQAIDRLRARKRRPHKPLAVMFPCQGKDELEGVRQYLIVNDAAKAALRSPARPIVLLPRRDDCPLPDNIAPNFSEIGVMLPYSPLHVLLLNRLGKPLIATSANISGEPVLTAAHDIKRRLSSISSNLLRHNRQIIRPVDDSVLRIIQQKARPLRLGRGLAPLELTLENNLPLPMLACGGHMKNTIALAWENRVVISPHIGDLQSPRAQQVFTQVVHDLQSLYQIDAKRIVHDAHPGYFSSRWAQQAQLPSLSIPHHHAHAAVLAGEYPQEKNWLVFTWDGVGLGSDHTLWGGEAFYGRAGQWARCASWRPFKLPGGDAAAREPWRCALSLCWEIGDDDVVMSSPTDASLLREAWNKSINSPSTTSIGRLFDAAAAFLNCCTHASFEGQAAMQVEHLARHGKHQGVPLTLTFDGTCWRSDWENLLPLLRDHRLSPADRAFAFHVSLAAALVDQATQLRHFYGDFAIGLSGGVFQNQLLCELITEHCRLAGWRLYIPQQVPVNDAGLSYGQVIEAAAKLQQGNKIHHV